MSERIVTESGAVYHLDGDRIMREGTVTELRRDGEWLTLMEPPTIKVGEPMVLDLEPLSPEAVMTRRVTTPVVEVSDEWHH